MYELVEDEIAEMILKDEIKSGDEIVIDADDNNIKISVK